MADKLPKNRKHPEANQKEAEEPAHAEEPAEPQDDIAGRPIRPLRPGQFGYDRDHWP